MLEAFLFITIPLLVWIIIIYNLLVRDKIRVQAGWSDIDVQLKRRHDLIPKLVDAVKQYAAFESATLTTITELRTRSEKSNQVGEIGDYQLDADWGLGGQLAGLTHGSSSVAISPPLGGIGQ